MHTGHDVTRRHKNPVVNASPVTKPMSKSAASINAHFGDFGIMLFKNCWQHQDVQGCSGKLGIFRPKFKVLLFR